MKRDGPSRSLEALRVIGRHAQTEFAQTAHYGYTIGRAVMLPDFEAAGCANAAAKQLPLCFNKCSALDSDSSGVAIAAD